ncbi:hypothetical protein DFR87_03525 [Metallosphaera hakonensis JCM 8857 = DSM 7519]|nr:hypothetical protein DFR87_03525 [Metallosphaera hakonensis JCM 8857 = DSM 7519]
MKFRDLVELMRRFGPNTELIGKLKGVSPREVENYLAQVKHLSFTPLQSNNHIRVKLQTGAMEPNYVRLSIKGKLSMIFSNNGAPVIKLENFSGNPEAYNINDDSWRMDADTIFEPLVYEYQYEGELEPIPISRFHSTKTMNELLISSLNIGTIQGFIVDYGKRDFVLLIATPYTEIKENLQLLPFIRYCMWLKDNEGTAFLMEFSIPEKNLKEVMEVIHEIKTRALVLLATPTFDLVKPVI